MAQKSVKMSKMTIKRPKMAISDILVDLWGHFSGVLKWHFDDLKCTFGFSRFWGSVGGPGN